MFFVFTQKCREPLPHARGGVSGFNYRVIQTTSSSPRPWGYFYVKQADGSYVNLFPTPVGVFLSAFTTATKREALPHARGGVSNRLAPVA